MSSDWPLVPVPPPVLARTASFPAPAGRPAQGLGPGDRVSASLGSGNTVLPRSWISQASAAGCAAWVPVGRAEHDPLQFWLSVLAALRQTDPGAALVQPLTAAPDLDGWAITERPLTDPAPLNNRLWLVLNDVHELGPEALRQLELLIMRAPPGLRFVLATRHDGAELLRAGRPARTAAKPVTTIFGVPGEGEKDERRIDRGLSGFGS